MIDLHCHVLAGIDDGPETIAGSLELARASAAAGVGTILATPHVSWRYPNTSATIAPALERLRERVAAEEVAIEILPGAEVAMTHVAELDPGELAGLGLGGGDWMLLEPPFSPVAGGLEGIVASVRAAGMRVLLAHPERCPAFHRDPALLRSLIEDGVLTSVTAGSLIGRFGTTARRIAAELLRGGMAHNVASDAHDVAGRAPGISAELERAGFAGLASWLTEEVPGAILAGGAIPPRPSGPGTSGEPARRWRLAR